MESSWPRSLRGKLARPQNYPRMLRELCDTSEAPLRKFRGKKRHFRKMLRKAGDFELHESPWWNYWHYHADWEGWGNLRWAYRREGLRALALVFRRIAQRPPAEPFQLWICLDGADAGQDAVYLHSPNPHSPFPFHPEVVCDDHRLLALMRELLPEFELRIGHSLGFFIYSPSVGVPLEPGKQ